MHVLAVLDVRRTIAIAIAIPSIPKFPTITINDHNNFYFAREPHAECQMKCPKKSEFHLRSSYMRTNEN